MGRLNKAMGKLIKDDWVGFMPGRQLKNCSSYCLWDRHVLEAAAALLPAKKLRHWGHEGLLGSGTDNIFEKLEQSDLEVNGRAEVLEGLSPQAWTWMNSHWLGDIKEISAEMLTLICLHLTVGVSLDSHPRETFFKCLYIIIKKDKENRQYWWPQIQPDL